MNVAAIRPTQFPERILEHLNAGLCLNVVIADLHQYADAAHSLVLLGASHEWPSRDGTEKRDELAPLHRASPDFGRAS
jgi:hypothetical protein